MSLNDLRMREKGLLNSHQERFIEYGRACKDLLQLCENYGGLRLSDDALISDMAIIYIEKEKENYKLTEKEKHLSHIKLAQEYIIKNFIKRQELKELLEEYEENLSFDEARTLLQETDFYERVSPKILKEVLDEIGTNYEIDGN